MAEADFVESCETCRFFLAKAPLHGKVSFVGDCRRYPPMYVLNDEISEPMFPYMAVDEWCGEYQRKFWNAPTPFPAEN